MREVFDEYKLRILDGDEAFYFRHDENGNLEGMVSSHVDDFILAGTEKTFKTIQNRIMNSFQRGLFLLSKIILHNIYIKMVEITILITYNYIGIPNISPF